MNHHCSDAAIKGLAGFVHVMLKPAPVQGNRALNFPERYTVDYAAGLQARGLQDVTEELLGQARDEGQFALMQQGRYILPAHSRPLLS